MLRPPFETMLMRLSYDAPLKLRAEVYGRLLAIDARLRGRKPLHFLHIGKTGGTAIKHAISGHTITARYRIILHDHAFRLHMVHANEAAFFILRDPVSRFRSGFESRKRRGQPRYDFAWTEDEAKAFTAFRSAEDLAMALGDGDADRKAAAVSAMRSIQHIRDSYAELFGGLEGLRSQLDKVEFVGFQEDLATGFSDLKTLAGLPDRLCLPNDELTAHRSPSGRRAALSEEAERNLREWYREDYHIYEFLRERWSPGRRN